MNLLWHSNSPQCSSGYGNQTKVFTKRIKQAGFGMAVSSFFGIESHSVVNGDGILELPRGTDLWGNDIIDGHIQFTQSNAVISLIDPFVLNPNIWGKHNWCAWTPVDSTPALPQIINVLKSTKWVWAMSHHGEAQLRAEGITNVTYVPHGVESSIYHPVDRVEAKAKFSEMFQRDITKSFLVVSNSANKGVPNRKNVSGIMEAFAKFQKIHTDAVLYIHAEPLGIYQGENLLLMAKYYGIENNVIFPSQYYIICGLYNEEQLNIIYSAADVYFTLSRGEGFGIPLVEAQMTGTPVISTNHSSMIELNFTGWLVDGLMYSFVPGTRQMIADTDKASRALHKAHLLWEDIEDYEKLRQDTARAALLYDADKVFEHYMLPALQKIQQEIEIEDAIVEIPPKVA